MGEREPVPELTEEGHADDGVHRLHPVAAEEGDGDVPTASVDDALGEGGAKLGHRVLVLVGDDGGKLLPDRGDGRVLRRRLLDEDHGERHERCLADKVDGILGHGLKQLDGLLAIEHREMRGKGKTLRRADDEWSASGEEVKNL